MRQMEMLVLEGQQLLESAALNILVVQAELSALITGVLRVVVELAVQAEPGRLAVMVLTEPLVLVGVELRLEVLLLV